MTTHDLDLFGIYAVTIALLIADACFSFLL